MPGILLKYIFSSRLDTSNKVDSTMYNSSRSAISRVSSEKLTEYERMKIISGIWESNTIELDTSKSDISEIDAVRLASEAVASLYVANCYPCDLSSSYNNWYSWSTKYYQSTETNFNTYSAFYWKITFYKYDSSEIHDVYITENGTLLAIQNNIPERMNRSGTNMSSASARRYFQNVYYKSSSITYLTGVTVENLPIYPFFSELIEPADTANLLVLNDDSIQTRDDFYAVTTEALSPNAQLYYEYHTISDEYYTMYLIPVNK